MKGSIVPHLWFDKEAKEAAQFYTGLFPNSRIVNTAVLADTPSGSAESVRFEAGGAAVSGHQRRAGVPA